MDELNSQGQDVLDTNRYVVLGTIDDDGRPRVSPVYFNHADYRDFYWVSSPESHHSRNIAARPRGLVRGLRLQRDPRAGPQAVYVDADAAEVPEAELAAECARAFAHLRGDGARAFAPEELSGDADLRLYRARATRHQVHVRGSDPDYGTGHRPPGDRDGLR